MASAPRDGTVVLARLRATEQGPAEVDAVRWSKSARTGEGGWVANDSDPFARVVYSDVELSSWMPLPTQMPDLRSARAAPTTPPADAAEEGDGSGM